MSCTNQQWIIIYLLIIVLVISVHLSYQLSSPNTETYKAAVVEYPSILANNGEETLRINSDAYVKHIKAAGLNDVDIIVFPEDGLTTVQLPDRKEMNTWSTIIPAVSENYTPCDQSTINVNEAIKKISCAAKENRVYVVINIAEKMHCTKSECAEDEKIYYNSNVVFDRNGKIIARYRKTNLFDEPQFNVTSVSEIVTFDTDFGVKFGTFICFDVLFYQPALQLTRVHHITDIVYPTAWYSEIPFLTAGQMHYGWAFAEDVNFLVSGYNNASSASMGSGIYLGRKGIGKIAMPINKHEELLIFDVPKIKEKTASNHYECHSNDHDETWRYYKGKEQIHDELRKKRESNMEISSIDHLLRDNIQAFNTIPLKGNVEVKICQNDFCCDFKVGIVRTDPNTEYRLAVFSGIRSFYVIDGGVQACGVVQCSNDSLLSCGSVKQSEMLFSKIEITATFNNYKNIVVMPSTLDVNLLPFEKADWKYVNHVNGDDMHVNITLINNKSNLIAFGLYSRYFD